MLITGEIKNTKLIKFPLPLGALALALLIAGITAGCNVEEAVTSPDALNRLAGSWYDSGCNFAFEITAEGEGYVAGKTTQYTVSVSDGNRVSFQGGYPTGSFRYSIKNGELTMTPGIGLFADKWETINGKTSPFIKSGTIPSGGKVPVELIGDWYEKSDLLGPLKFEITKSGGMTIPGPEAEYTVKVSGNTITVWSGSFSKGTFKYSFVHDEMSITYGTEICVNWEDFSPLVKNNS
jgi:hypothetical protein